MSCHVMCHIPCMIYHISYIMYHISHIIYHISHHIRPVVSTIYTSVRLTVCIMKLLIVTVQFLPAFCYWPFVFSNCLLKYLLSKTTCFHYLYIRSINSVHYEAPHCDGPVFTNILLLTVCFL